MALTKGTGIIVTGEEKLDKAMAALPVKLQKKYLRKAVREVGKRVKADAASNTPRDSGAMAASLQIRATSKTIKSGTGKFRTGTSKSGFQYKFEVQRAVGQDIGVSVGMTRAGLAKQLTKRGKIEEAAAVLKDDKGFYPAFVELGRHARPATPSLRSALKKAERWSLGLFRHYLAKFVLYP